MFNGTVILEAEIRGIGLKFPAFDFNPNEPGVDKVTIEGPGGDRVLCTVHVTSVATEEGGRERAVKVTEAALERLAYLHIIAVADAQITGDHLFPVFPAKPPAGAPYCDGWGPRPLVSGRGKVVIRVPPATLKPKLEQAAPPGERYYDLYRSALLSTSPVEAFMHLYNLLLMLYSDSQSNVDTFIVAQDPAVPRTQHPKKKAGVMETVYTRLRNEFAHPRPGVNLASTKVEMAQRFNPLRDLVKKAIELHP
jgi:hypothetical protein